MKRTLLYLAASTMLVASPLAHSTLIKYTATLNGANEVVPNFSTGTGVADVTIDDVLNTMRVQVAFQDLIAPTIVAHIHCCTAVPMTGTIAVATTTPSFVGFPAGVTAGTYDNILDLTQTSTYNGSFVTSNGGTTAGAELALLNGLLAGEAYFNIHTSLYAGGEIRGFFVPVRDPVGNPTIPEPATLSLLGLGLAGIGFLRRRKGS